MNPRPSGRIRGIAINAALVLISSYLTLLACEAFLHVRSASLPRFESERGLYRPDPELGVVLTPGYVSRFDDGHARGEIRINHLGQRDAEPGDGDRILLVGDSFAFGALLDQSDTIDKWMERIRPGLDVYNLGVSGYNLPDQLIALRRCSLRAQGVLYLFFGNDLEPPDEQTVVDGYRVVRSRRKDGTPASDADLRLLLRLNLAQTHRIVSISPRLPLVQFLVTRGAEYALRGGGPPDDRLSEAQRSRLVERGLRYTLEMRDEAVRRGESFAVAILPAREEVLARAYSPAVARYAEALHRAGVTPVEMISTLQGDDYWGYNPHLNSHGASTAARSLLRGLSQAQWNLPGPVQ